MQGLKKKHGDILIFSQMSSKCKCMNWLKKYGDTSLLFILIETIVTNLVFWLISIINLTNN